MTALGAAWPKALAADTKSDRTRAPKGQAANEIGLKRGGSEAAMVVVIVRRLIKEVVNRSIAAIVRIGR